MKRWYLSRTLWVNVIAGVAMVVQAATSQEWIDAEAQVGILAVINLLMRAITKQQLTR